MLARNSSDTRFLRSTITGQQFPFERLQEFTDDYESLEVVLPYVADARPRPGANIWERFSEFLPFDKMDESCSLGEGGTPLLRANARLQELTGVTSLLLKDETQNPTWSFKDRGSLTCLFMARAMGEPVTATISTGNMGNSIAAYAARADIQSIVFIPHFAPEQKIQAILMHGATVIRVSAPDYALMKTVVLDLAEEFQLRIVSGNGPVRVEGYKLIAFELYEQLNRRVPDYIAVPTSACGHVRGIWKGWHELQLAGLVERLPRMIVVQAANNSPIVSAFRLGAKQVIPFTNFHTVAEAITSGNPPGGDEILHKAYAHDWLAEDVTEDEILDAQRHLALAGHFVEPATATSLHAIRKLVANGSIEPDATVVMMLTGSGLKDLEVMKFHDLAITDTTIESVRDVLAQLRKRS